MAWLAELKRRHWYCINQLDMVAWYSNKLYEDWWSSLTPEQKERVEEYRRKKKEKEHREALQAINNILSFGAALYNVYNK